VPDFNESFKTLFGQCIHKMKGKLPVFTSVNNLFDKLYEICTLINFIRKFFSYMFSDTYMPSCNSYIRSDAGALNPVKICRTF